MADERVRQAINYAFDRKTLLATVFNGAGRLLWVDAGFDPTDPKLDHYDFNPDKAKSAARGGRDRRQVRPEHPDPDHLLDRSRPAGTRSRRRSTTTSRPSA